MTHRPSLKKTLGVTQATALGITIVVGSGLLLLPGLAYHHAGATSYYVWIFCALLVMPLLVIFSALGARFPTAGGIAGFMQHAFSRNFAAATEVLLMGTFGLGIPAIALTGSYYLHSLLPPEWNLSDSALSLLLLAVAFGVNYRGAQITGKVQYAVAIFLVLSLLLIPALALIFSTESSGAGIAAPRLVEIPQLLPLFGMVFFAFTGWELLSFTIEEYKNPRRDYPISVALSFLIVIFLYLFLIFAIQILLPQSHPLMRSSPLAALAGHAFGAIASKLVAILSCIIILANLIGAVWAASRLVFSSAREGLLPQRVAQVDKNQTPHVALSITCGLFVVAILIYRQQWLGIDDMLRLAGQNFFILYGLAVVAYIKIAASKIAKAFGLLCLGIVGSTMGTFGADLMYPACLWLTGYAACKYRAKLHERTC